ncbi:MAG: hypothetical protein ACOYYS_17375 [Chloroflexota bacterium]
MKASAKHHLPDTNRLSVLVATFILAYGMTHFIVLPVREFDIQFAGFYLAADIGANTLISLIVAALATSGSDWLLRDHPKLVARSAWQHSLLPALAAWVIGILLAELPFGVTWMMSLATGSLTLTLIVIAEYIAIDPEDLRYPLAGAWLSAVAYVLFLILAIALRAVNTRLVLMIPALLLASFLVCLRVLQLRLHGEWLPFDALLIAFLMSQLTAALHYWPLTPIQFGALQVGLIYGFTSLIGNIAEGKTMRQSLAEPLIGLALAICVAIWLP